MDKNELLYRGRVIDLFRETVTLPNGAEAELEIVRHPGGAAAVAVDDAGRVCLLRQYRHAAAGWVWELPAGRLDPDEAPLAAAQRELQEEAAVRAARWQPLGGVLSSPGVFTEVIHLFLAQTLSPAAGGTEDHEVIEVHWVPLEEALARAANGDINDAKTVIGLFRAQRLVRDAGGVRA